MFDYYREVDVYTVGGVASDAYVMLRLDVLGKKMAFTEHNIGLEGLTHSSFDLENGKTIMMLITSVIYQPQGNI